MKRSIDRILTTHVGSLPRGAAILDLLNRKDAGETVDEALFERTLHDAVDDAVRAQVAAGIDAVSDGEMSKIGYSTYMKNRLTGFSGDSPRRVPRDLADYPEYRDRLARSGQSPKIKRPVCSGPIALKDRREIDRDIGNFRDALAKNAASEGFLTAASPGVIGVFQPNEFYPSFEAYLEAVAEAMRPEYEAIANAGFVLQLDCPDLAMGWHNNVRDFANESEFLASARLQIEVLNHAVRNIPADRLRMHLCWGNYEGPHHHDIPLNRIVDVVLKAKPAGISFEAANPRHQHEWKVWQATKIPQDKLLLPGVIDSSTNFIEPAELVADRIETFAKIVGRECVIAGTDCGFGTFAGFGKVDPAIAYVKLKAMAEGARLATKRLWG